METKISNISFQANLVTSIQGRNGIMTDVAKRFAEKTKGINGTFEISRGKTKFNKALVLNCKEIKKPYYIYNYSDLTGANQQERSEEVIDNIAECYSRIFRMLKAQSSYEKVSKKHNKSRAKTETALNANKKTLNQAKLNGQARFESLYLSMIDQNKAKLTVLDNIIKNAKRRYLSLLESIAGNNARAKECVETLLTN